MTTTDRLSPITTLTPDEREQARTAFAERPLILDDLIMAALGHCERGEEIAAAIIDRVRGGAS
jgi:hypothetical protein